LQAGLQWGHVFSDVGIERRGKKLKGKQTLQWGHVFSDVGIETSALLYSHFLQASMGPRLFRRGNTDRPIPKEYWNLRLQWGHVFSDVGILLAINPEIKTQLGFNGATSFQTWEW